MRHVALGCVIFFSLAAPASAQWIASGTSTTTAPAPSGPPFIPFLSPPSSLLQSNPGGSPIPPGAAALGTTVIFSGLNTTSGAAQLEVEIQWAGIPFVNVPSLRGPSAASGAIASASAPHLPEGSFRWQARLASNNGFSAWGSYPSGSSYSDLSADFIIDTNGGYQSSFDHAVGWTGDGLWGVDATPSSMPGGPFVSAPSSLNYNDGVDYDYTYTPTTPIGPTSGSAQSPRIDVSALGSPVLRFQCNYETDTPGTATDQRWVRIYSFDGIDILPLEQEIQFSTGTGGCAAMGVWHEHVVPLDGLTWSTVVVSFDFDSITADDNTHPGWFIDDFSVADSSGSDGGSGGAPPGDGSTAAGGGGDGGSASGLCSAAWGGLSLLPSFLALPLLLFARRRVP